MRTSLPRRSIGPALGAFLLLLSPVPAGFAQAAVWTSGDIKLSDAGKISLTALSGQAAALMPDGSLYAVWYERTAQRASNVRGASRSPAGAWLEQDVRISLGDSLSRNPTVAVSSKGDVHVVWEDLRHGAGEEIYYRHRTPEGVWDDEVRVTASDFPSLSPVVAIGPGDRLHLVWSDASPGNYEIFYAFLDPGGVWSTPERLTFDVGNSLTPVLAVEPDGSIDIAWQDNILNPVTGDDPNNTEIYYLHLSAAGVPIGAPVRVSNALGSSRNPTIALGPDGALHIFWSDNRDPASISSDYFPFSIWYRRRLPGLGFGYEKRFIFTPSDHLNPSASVSRDGIVNVVWEDYAHGNSEIYFRQIRPATGWEVPVRLTQTVGPTRNPTILADGDNNLHLIWSDTSPGELASVRYRIGKVSSTTPVVLAKAALSWEGESLIVSWDTSSEVNHAGFMVQGVPDLSDEPRDLLASPVTGGPHYETSLAPEAIDGLHFIRLVAIARDGSTETVAALPIPAHGAGAVPVAELRNVYPNPSRGRFMVPVVSGGGKVSLGLFDVAGRSVAARNLGTLAAGETDVSWNPGDSGEALAAGRYWLRMTVDGKSVGRPIPIQIMK